MKYSACIILFLFTISVYAQSENKEIIEGNEKYKQNDLIGAEQNYNSAITKNPASEAAHYNLGNTQYQQKNFEKAIEEYKKTAETTTDPKVRAQAFHNMGNAMVEQKKYQEGIDAYKQSLRNNPDDQDTKYNLTYAQKMLKQQQDQQKKEDEKKDENKDQQDKKDQQQNKDQQKKEPQQNKDQQPQQSQPKQYSKEELERILQSLNADDKNVQDKVNKQKTKSTGGDEEKDW